MQRFEYPIGLVLFNRPTYHQALLESLTRQTLPPDQSIILAHIDSYQGSRDQEAGRPDFTETTAQFVDQYLQLPQSQVITPQRNRGISRSLTVLEESLFEGRNSQWALIIEGDMVLSPHALKVIDRCIKEADHHPKVGVINFDYADWVQRDTRFSFVRGHGTRIYALRRNHHFERMIVVDTFNQLLVHQSYQNLSYDQVLSALAPLRVYPSNALQDAMRTATAVAFHRIQIAPTVRIAAHIGQYGQNNIYTDGRIPALPEYVSMDGDEPDLESLKLSRTTLVRIEWELIVRRLRVFRKLSHHRKWILVKSVLRVRWRP